MAKRESTRIIYSTHFHGKGFAIGVDSHNLTLLHFKKGLDPNESRRRWHFNSLPKLLRAAHQYFLKERIKRLPFDDLAQAVERSFEQVEILGQELVAEIIRQAPSGSLPRFPCNHEVCNSQQEKRP